MSSRSDPLIGATLADRYVVEELVGEGAMGLVYRAHHARLSRRFALKMMFGDVAAEPAMRMRFAQEADAASRLSHPNVVSVVDFGRTEHGLLYLAMDYAEGETLASVIRREGPLGHTRVVALARQMCRGLQHAHHAGLVHRDFKPANVMVAPTDEGGELARILDFGLAISEREGDRVARLTEHGLVVGTPIYIAPEQARDRPVDHRADLFALGVVMYEMLAGRTPFEGTGPEIAKANVTERPPALSVRNPKVSVPPELEAIVFRLLEKRPDSRFQCADDVVLALDQLGRGRREREASGGGEPGTHAGTPSASSTGGGGTSRWRRRRGRGRRARGSTPAGRWPLLGGRVRAPEGSEHCAGNAGRRGVHAHGHGPARRVPRSGIAVGVGAEPGVGAGGAVGDAVPACAGEPSEAARPDATWGPERDQLPTVRLNRVAMRRVAAAVGEMQRRGVSAATWLALATSGAVFAITGGIRSEALERPAPAAMRIGRGAAVGGARELAVLDPSPFAALDRPLRREMVLVTRLAGRVPAAIERVPAVIESVRVRHEGEGPAQGQIGGPNEGKMAARGARRCSNVQDAGPTGARAPSPRGHRARHVDLAKCRGLEARAEAGPPVAAETQARQLGSLITAPAAVRSKGMMAQPVGAPVVEPAVSPAPAQMAQ